jgi:hypothetical protein
MMSVTEFAPGGFVTTISHVMVVVGRREPLHSHPQISGYNGTLQFGDLSTKHFIIKILIPTVP